MANCRVFTGIYLKRECDHAKQNMIMRIYFFCAYKRRKRKERGIGHRRRQSVQAHLHVSHGASNLESRSAYFVYDPGE